MKAGQAEARDANGKIAALDGGSAGPPMAVLQKTIETENRAYGPEKIYRTRGGNGGGFAVARKLS
jgi:hypothetical protein